MEWPWNANLENRQRVKFVPDLKNLTAQEKLYTEPKYTQRDALDFAIEIDFRQKNAKSLDKNRTSVCKINQKNDCTKCGAGSFTCKHAEQRGKSAKTGDFGRVCKKPQTQNNFNIRFEVRI